MTTIISDLKDRLEDLYRLVEVRNFADLLGRQVEALPEKKRSKISAADMGNIRDPREKLDRLAEDLLVKGEEAISASGYAIRSYSCDAPAIEKAYQRFYRLRKDCKSEKVLSEQQEALLTKIDDLVKNFTVDAQDYDDGSEDSDTDALVDEVHDYYEEHHLSGPGFIFGVAVKEPKNFVAKMFHSAVNFEASQMMALKDQPELCKILEEDFYDGETIDRYLARKTEECVDQGLRKAKMATNMVYKALGTKDNHALEARYAIFVDAHAEAIREDMPRYVNVMTEIFHVQADYAHAGLTKEEQQQCTAYFDYLRRHPEAMTKDHVLYTNERIRSFSHGVATSFAAGIYPLLEEIKEAGKKYKTTNWEKKVEALRERYFEFAKETTTVPPTTVFTSELERLFETFLRYDTVNQILYSLPLRLEGGAPKSAKNIGRPLENFKQEDLAGRHQAMFALRKTLTPDAQKYGPLWTNPWIKALTQPLESMKPDDARQAVRESYRLAMMKLCRALNDYKEVIGQS